MEIASLILGIWGLLLALTIFFRELFKSAYFPIGGEITTFLLSVIPLFTSIIGLVLGIISLKRAYGNRAIGISSIVINSTILLGAVPFFIFINLFFYTF